MEKNFSKGGALSVDKLIEERANILRLIVEKIAKTKNSKLDNVKRIDASTNVILVDDEN